MLIYNYLQNFVLINQTIISGKYGLRNPNFLTNHKVRVIQRTHLLKNIEQTTATL